MNLQFKTAYEVHNFFSDSQIPYVIIGGIALQRWGEPRFTRDVDVTVLVNPGEEEKILNKLLIVFSPRIPDAFEFALKHRVCLVYSSEGCEIDISFGIPGYEDEVIQRAVECCPEEGWTFRICSAEDLIIHKAVAGRPKDISDIESVIIRQSIHLDIVYIRKWLTIFSNLLEMKEVLNRFEIPWKKFMKKK